MLVLAIESSCDETAAAIVRDGRSLLSNVISSQIDVHSKYGGVVPEIASRKHIEAIGPVIMQALDDAGATFEDIEGVAVTRGPGLIGSLLVGLSVAKAVAFARDLPLVGVNHLEGHVASVFLSETRPEFPFIALVVSGGHTNIYYVGNFKTFQTIGQTRDDAAGEAFDKAAETFGYRISRGSSHRPAGKSGRSRLHKFSEIDAGQPRFQLQWTKNLIVVIHEKKDITD